MFLKEKVMLFTQALKIPKFSTEKKTEVKVRNDNKTVKMLVKRKYPGFQLG